MGGRVAQIVASRELEEVAGLILVAPAPARFLLLSDAMDMQYVRAYENSETFRDFVVRFLTS